MVSKSRNWLIDCLLGSNVVHLRRIATGTHAKLPARAARQDAKRLRQLKPLAIGRGIGYKYRCDATV